MATVALVLGFVFNVLKVVFGLGFVIFIHELGHFLAAKWAGVKVEKGKVVAYRARLSLSFKYEG